MTEKKYSAAWREIVARNPPKLRIYTKQEIKTLTTIVDELEKDIEPLNLPKLHSDVYSAIQHAENSRMKIDEWESEMKLRNWSDAWIVDGAKVYDKTNGRIGSVEGKKAARYLEGRAARSTGAKRQMYLKQASLVESEAEKLYREREQIHVSPPI